MPTPEVALSVSADGRTTAEAEVADPAEAASLVAAGRAAGAELIWAHSVADLSALGFRRAWGYRRLEGPARHDRTSADGSLSADADVTLLSAAEENAALWAAAFSGQWGHKTPASWPLDLPPGTRTLALRRNGMITGVCRCASGTGLIDAPGLITGYRDVRDYRTLLTAALDTVRTESVTVESWGDSPERVGICERFGLATVEYVPGWELDVAADIGSQGSRSGSV